MAQLRALWWWIDRWRKSTAYTDMTLEEQGAYRNLLDEQTLRGGFLPDDERILAKACGDALAWPRVRVAVMARFELVTDGWHNVTLTEVNVKSSQLKETRSAAGAKGAAARWNGKNMAKSSQTVSQSAKLAIVKVSQTVSPPSPYPSQEIKSVRTGETWSFDHLRVPAGLRLIVEKEAGDVAEKVDWKKLYSTASDDYAHAKPQDEVGDLKRRAKAAAKLYRDGCIDVAGIAKTRAYLADLEAKAATPEQRAADVAAVRAMFTGAR